VNLNEGNILFISLTAFPKLLHGTKEERENYRFIGKGEGIHLPLLNKDLSVEWLLEDYGKGT
jgi:hypothetical protein